MPDDAASLKARLIEALPRLLSPMMQIRLITSGAPPAAPALMAGAPPARHAASADLAVEVAMPARGRRRLLVKVHADAVPGRVREPLRRLKAASGSGAPEYPLLASTFLSPRVRAICREEGVGYLDLAGNCFLQFDGLYVEKVVEDNPFPRRGRPASLFSPVSSRIIRLLLEAPRRVWTVQELARASRASLGQTFKVCLRLIEEEYAMKTPRPRRRLQLAQPGRLLEAWRDAPPPRPRAALGYYSFERDPERLLKRVAEAGKRHQLRYAVTSLAAASLVAPFLRGIGAVHWYVEDEAAAKAWARALELRPAEAGPNAVLLVPCDSGVFTPVQTISGVTLVGTVQLYLDLFHEHARGREQAEFLRHERLKF